MCNRAPSDFMPPNRSLRWAFEQTTRDEFVGRRYFDRAE